MNILSTIYSLISSLVQKILGFVEMFLFLRLILKFLNANPETLVVKLLFTGTEFLIYPFKAIFPNVYFGGFYFLETSTVSAMIGYPLASFLFLQLLRLFSRE